MAARIFFEHEGVVRRNRARSDRDDSTDHRGNTCPGRNRNDRTRNDRTHITGPIGER